MTTPILDVGTGDYFAKNDMSPAKPKFIKLESSISYNRQYENHFLKFSKTPWRPYFDNGPLEEDGSSTKPKPVDHDWRRITFIE